MKWSDDTNCKPGTVNWDRHIPSTSNRFCWGCGYFNENGVCEVFEYKPKSSADACSRFRLKGEKDGNSN